MNHTTDGRKEGIVQRSFLQPEGDILLDTDRPSDKVHAMSTSGTSTQGLDTGNHANARIQPSHTADKTKYNADFTDDQDLEHGARPDDFLTPHQNAQTNHDSVRNPMMVTSSPFDMEEASPSQILFGTDMRQMTSAGHEQRNYNDIGNRVTSPGEVAEMHHGLVDESMVASTMQQEDGMRENRSHDHPILASSDKVEADRRLLDHGTAGQGLQGNVPFEPGNTRDLANLGMGRHSVGSSGHTSPESNPLTTLSPTPMITKPQAKSTTGHATGSNALGRDDTQAHVKPNTHTHHPQLNYRGATPDASRLLPVDYEPGQMSMAPPASATAHMLRPDETMDVELHAMQSRPAPRPRPPTDPSSLPLRGTKNRFPLGSFVDAKTGVQRAMPFASVSGTAYRRSGARHTSAYTPVLAYKERAIRFWKRTKNIDQLLGKVCISPHPSWPRY